MMCFITNTLSRPRYAGFGWMTWFGFLNFCDNKA